MKREVNRVSTKFVRMFRRYLAGLGVPIEPLLAANGIDPAIIGDPEAEIEIHAFARVMEAAAEFTGNSCLGLEWARTYPLSGTGILGYVITYSRTVREALLNSAHYANLSMTPVESRATFERNGGREIGNYSWSWPSWLGRDDVQYKYFMSALLLLRLRTGTSRPWTPLAVALETVDVNCRALIREIFGPQVTFKAPRNVIGVDEADLALEYTVADKRLLSIIKDRADRLLAELPPRGVLVQDVRAAILDRLGKGDVSLEIISNRLNVPARTLQARLAQQSGMNFEAILCETRQDLARHYLAKTDLHLTEIALILGYSELSAFTRASQRWFGLPPSQLRQQLKA